MHGSNGHAEQANGALGLLRARLAAGLSQQQLAERAGCTRGAISQLERGLCRPRLTTRVLLAHALSKAPEQLFPDDGPGTASPWKRKPAPGDGPTPEKGVDRYLDPTELSVEQLIEREQARNAGRPEPRFERPEWLRARRELLVEHGFETDDALDTTDPDLESLDVDAHFDLIRRNR